MSHDEAVAHVAGWMIGYCKGSSPRPGKKVSFLLSTPQSRASLSPMRQPINASSDNRL